MEFDMSHSIDWIAYNYLFLSLREMHYGKNITKMVYDWSGSGNEKFGWNLSEHELHQITSVSAKAIKLFKIRQWDTTYRTLIFDLMRNLYLYIHCIQKNWHMCSVSPTGNDTGLVLLLNKWGVGCTVYAHLGSRLLTSAEAIFTYLNITCINKRDSFDAK